jgi:Outer membrane protein beta-barrel domain
MRLRYVYGALFFVAFCSIPAARAQTSFDLNMGFGTAWDKSNGQGIEGVDSVNAFGSCSPSAPVDIYCESTPGLHGFFLGFGGDLMLTKRFGVGAEVSFQPSKPDYGPLLYRQTFYDFNGIYAPINRKRVMVEIMGGIGGAHTSFSINESGCVGIAVCSTEVLPVGTSNHFQLHVGVGLQLFVIGHLFVRPQFDYHYVENFTQQFNSSSVPEAMVWVGYSFGER